MKEYFLENNVKVDSTGCLPYPRDVGFNFMKVLRNTYEECTLLYLIKGCNIFPGKKRWRIGHKLLRKNIKLVNCSYKIFRMSKELGTCLKIYFNKTNVGSLYLKLTLSLFMCCPCYLALSSCVCCNVYMLTIWLNSLIIFVLFLWFLISSHQHYDMLNFCIHGSAF